MFKLVVLSALLAVVAARPGYIDHGLPSAVYYASPTLVHEPAYAKVGAIVKSIPTAVSHQSSSVVHSSAHVVQPILAPVVKTSYVAAPLLHSAPYIKSYASAPALHAGWDSWAPAPAW